MVVSCVYDVHRLRLLRELKLRGTLAAVAQALAYSPSSVSEQLSQLESEVGVPLLERVGRRVRLTAQAEILVGHAAAVLQRLEEAESDVAASLTQVTGQLRIATFQTAALALVPAALTTMRLAHPRLRVHVRHREPEFALLELAARDFDLVIVEEYPGDPLARLPGVTFSPLCSDALRLAPSGGGRKLADLASQPWIMEPRGAPARRWAAAMCRATGFEPDVRFESTDLLLHVRMVEQGHAAAFLPNLVWAGLRPTVELIDLPTGRGTRRIVTACRDGAARHPAVRAFRTALAGAARAADARTAPG